MPVHSRQERDTACPPAFGGHGLLHSGVDTTVIALWLGHESPATTRVYLHADMALKQQALSRLAPDGTPLGRYTPPDSLLAFLDAL